ncbi:MAG: hypothetical protein ACRD1T_01165 [Acidimicrobiia bacterium]
MKRRAILRTAIYGGGAFVFAGAGWLMGARALTMGSPPPGYVRCSQTVSIYWGSTCHNFPPWSIALWYTYYDYYDWSYCYDIFYNCYSSCNPN